MEKKKTKININTSEEKDHSEFGGSQAERILNCPGSVLLCRDVPDVSNETAASTEGTEAHACLEFFILNREKLRKKITRTKVLAKAEEKWTQTMIDHALDALSYIEEQVQPGGLCMLNKKLKQLSSPLLTKTTDRNQPWTFALLTGQQGN